MPRRQAYTLLEILIVLSLIVVIAAVSMPGIQRLQVRSELKSTAQKLQGELYATRLEAMKTGEAYLFRFQSETENYEILPKKIYDALDVKPQTTAPVDLTQTRSVGADLRDSVLTPPQKENEPAPRVDPVYRKRLPLFYTFGTVKPVETDRNTPDAFATRSVGGPRDSLLDPQQPDRPPEPVWSEPIYFFPNGRTSNGSLEIFTTGTYRFQIELTLRGLTGTARLGEIVIPP